MNTFSFKHIKTPGWARSSNDIYFLVLDEEKNNFGYIGLQEVDFSRGICGNLCYKTHVKYRGQGKSKYYVKQFIQECMFDIDLWMAYVVEENVSSRKILEYCGFSVEDIKDGRIYYKLRKFDF